MSHQFWDSGKLKDIKRKCITVSPYINSRVVLTHRLQGAQKKNITDDIDSIDTSWCFWIPKHLNTIKHPKIRGLWLLWDLMRKQWKPKIFRGHLFWDCVHPHRLGIGCQLGQTSQLRGEYHRKEMCKNHWGLNGFNFWMVYIYTYIYTYIYKHILFHGGWNMMDTHTHQLEFHMWLWVKIRDLRKPQI